MLAAWSPLGELIPPTKLLAGLREGERNREEKGNGKKEGEKEKRGLGREREVKGRRRDNMGPEQVVR